MSRYCLPPFDSVFFKIYMYPFKTNVPPGQFQEEGRFVEVFKCINYQQTNTMVRTNFGNCRFFYIQTKFEKKIVKSGRVINPCKISGKSSKYEVLSMISKRSGFEMFTKNKNNSVTPF